MILPSQVTHPPDCELEDERNTRRTRSRPRPRWNKTNIRVITAPAEGLPANLNINNRRYGTERGGASGGFVLYTANSHLEIDVYKSLVIVFNHGLTGRPLPACLTLIPFPFARYVQRDVQHDACTNTCFRVHPRWALSAGLAPPRHGDRFTSKANHLAEMVNDGGQYCSWTLRNSVASELRNFPVINYSLLAFRHPSVVSNLTSPNNCSTKCKDKDKILSQLSGCRGEYIYLSELQSGRRRTAPAPNRSEQTRDTEAGPPSTRQTPNWFGRADHTAGCVIVERWTRIESDRSDDVGSTAATRRDRAISFAVCAHAPDRRFTPFRVVDYVRGEECQVRKRVFDFPNPIVLKPMGYGLKKLEMRKQKFLAAGSSTTDVQQYSYALIPPLLSIIFAQAEAFKTFPELLKTPPPARLGPCERDETRAQERQRTLDKCLINRFIVAGLTWKWIRARRKARDWL
ncbi:hypothetical protein EVAR_28367_1 [Eumeta japonica]|uniref:Uncharacterized protein n=1 Tax=Eumeta variegata TaxID=151549 RepID=A0A4C1ZYI5_EUMVA|nr:hypothetical protein EVAR_28367_1 [Eumeta japonica]